MGALHELQHYLVTSTGLGLRDPLSTGAGVPVWTGRMPATTGPGVGLYHYGGLPPVPALAQAIPVVVQPSIQILVRSTSYDQAESIANGIHDRLFGLINADLSLGLASTSTGTIRWLLAAPSQSPYDIGKDPLGRDMLSCNYSIMRVTT